MDDPGIVARGDDAPEVAGVEDLARCRVDADFILSKLERNSAKDRDDTDYIFKTKKLSSQTLQERYEKELRPYLSKENWHNDTLKLWIEIFEKPK